MAEPQLRVPCWGDMVQCSTRVSSGRWGADDVMYMHLADERCPLCTGECRELPMIPTLREEEW